MAEAKVLLSDADEAAQAANNHLRQVVAFRLLAEVSRQLAGAFSIGPAWTLMRAVSGYIHPDRAFLDELDEDAREQIATLTSSAAADSTEMLDLLDLYAGDPHLELRLRAVVLKALRKHHAPVAQELEDRKTNPKPLSAAAKRLRRRTEDRKTSVRLGSGALSDRHDVLSGLIRSAGSGDEAADLNDL